MKKQFYSMRTVFSWETILNEHHDCKCCHFKAETHFYLILIKRRVDRNERNSSDKDFQWKLIFLFEIRLRADWKWNAFVHVVTFHRVRCLFQQSQSWSISWNWRKSSKPKWIWFLLMNEKIFAILNIFQVTIF